MTKKNKKTLVILLMVGAGIAIARKIILKYYSDKFPLPQPKKTTSNVSIPEILPQQPKPYKKAIVINVGTKGLNVRQDRSTTSDILGNLKNGSIIGYLPTGDPNWVSIILNPGKDNQINGFCSTKYLKLTNESFPA